MTYLCPTALNDRVDALETIALGLNCHSQLDVLEKVFDKCKSHQEALSTDCTFQFDDKFLEEELMKIFNNYAESTADEKNKLFL